MCAIAGMVGLPYNRTLMEKMLLTMHRRGPDGKGLFETDDCGLLHTRLAVIDPENGKQPMHLHWEGNSYTIVYNGELYNTKELRNELLRLGHIFITSTDTEVLLHCYAQWGEKCLYKLNGIFAFGIWEEETKKLFLARDRMGVKPLFYKLHEGGIIFASEIKTILCYPTVKSELDAYGAAQILMLGPGRIPGSGVLKGIEELEPGCCGTFCCGKWNRTRYWRLQDRQHTETFEETAEHVRYLVKDAIMRQTVSDVPLGTFLSGGLDSSLISSICASDMRSRGERLDTFSVDYKNNEKYFVPGKFQPNSDNSYIEIMKNTLETNHHWTVLTPDDLLASMEEATLARDLPGMADVDFSLLAFCGHIKKHVKVALSGECADEIFGGYPWFTDPQIRALDGFPWAQNTKQRCSLLAPWITDLVDVSGMVTDLYQSTLSQCDILPGTSAQEIRMKQMVVLNQKWFMQTLLDRKDRMSMYHGLEVRVPFCDHRIAEYMYGVPWEFKYYAGKEKGLLRHAMKNYLPEEVLWRKKSPYPKTYDPRYLQLVHDRAKNLLMERNAPVFQLIRPEKFETLIEEEYAWPWYGQLMRLPQTIAYILQIDIWLRNYNIAVV